MSYNFYNDVKTIIIKKIYLGEFKEEKFNLNFLTMSKLISNKTFLVLSETILNNNDLLTITKIFFDEFR